MITDPDPTRQAEPHPTPSAPSRRKPSMTISAATASPAPQPFASVDYQPGVCNIGPAEISRRRRAGHVGLIAAVALFAILVAIGAPPIARLLLVIPVAVSASGYLQAYLKFCAGFGSRGVFNFGDVGQTHQVADADARRRDRTRATQIGVAAGVIGVLVGIVAVLLPL